MSTRNTDPTPDAGLGSSEASDASNGPHAELDTLDASSHPDTEFDASDASDASSYPKVGREKIDVFALATTSDAGPAGVCIGCVKTQCGAAINGCVSDPKCRQGLVCALAQCSKQSGEADAATVTANRACFVDCSQGDLSTATQAVSAVNCVYQTCADPCDSRILNGT